MRKALALFLVMVCAACGGKKKGEVRIGYFPNLTHAQALVGMEKGDFQAALPGRLVTWKSFNAGPSVIEALFAGELDLAYVGPNPALNGWIKSKGEALKVVAGAAEGGAGLVVQAGADFKGPASLRGKKLSTPQFGNTQDIAARLWILDAGLDPEKDVDTTPLANADALLLFQKKALAAAWTVEPWVSRLEAEAGARLVLEEKSLWPKGRYVTTCLIGARGFLEKDPDAAARLVQAHAAVTRWIQSHAAEAGALVNARLKADTGKALDEKVLKRAWSRIRFTSEMDPSLLIKAGEKAARLNFIKGSLPSEEQIFDGSFLKGQKQK